MSKQKDRILTALRHFRHTNDNSPDLLNPRMGFAVAYDCHVVDTLVAYLEARNEKQHKIIMQLYSRIASMEAENAEQHKVIMQLCGKRYFMLLRIKELLRK